MDSASRTSALLAMARSLMRAGDLTELLDEILQRARDVMVCEVCSILLPEAPGGDLVIRSTRGDRLPDGPLRVPPGLGISGFVFQNRQLVNTVNAQEDPRHFSPRTVKTGLLTRAMLSLPLMDGAECLGVMQAINPDHGGAFTAEDEGIFETLGSLVSATLVRVQAHESAVREAAARREFALANEIQQSFLPPPRADAPPFEIQAFYQPASEVGGDFYFYHRIDEHLLLAGLGDVCGKGLAASLDMARCSTLIPSLTHLLQTQPLGGWVSRLNDQLCLQMRPGRFVAATFLLADVRSGRVEVVAAGQFPPLVPLHGRWQPLPGETGPPLGIAPGLTYRAKRVPLGLSREWLLYSDGLVELRNVAGDYFGDAAFEQTLAALPPGSRTLDVLVDAWRAFSSAPHHRDDCSVVWLRDTRPAPHAELHLVCGPESIRDGRAFFEQWAVFAGCDEPTAGLVALATDEVLTNLHRHAYEGKGGPVTCTATLEPTRLVLRLIHSGCGIASCDLPPPSPACPDRPGGMGMCVVRSVFETVELSKGGEKSEILLVKELDLQARPEAG